MEEIERTTEVKGQNRRDESEGGSKRKKGIKKSRVNGEGEMESGERKDVEEGKR